jgi:hypothetical protein
MILFYAFISPTPFHLGMMFGFTTWVEPQLATQYQDNQAQDLLAYHAQGQIGWQHFIGGRLSQEWAFYLLDHYKANNITHITTDQWATGLLKLMWHNILALWELRNKEVHGFCRTQLLVPLQV